MKGQSLGFEAKEEGMAPDNSINVKKTAVCIINQDFILNVKVKLRNDVELNKGP